MPSGRKPKSRYRRHKPARLRRSQPSRHLQVPLSFRPTCPRYERPRHTQMYRRSPLIVGTELIEYS
jgi:hypothetical protein